MRQIRLPGASVSRFCFAPGLSVFLPAGQIPLLAFLLDKLGYVAEYEGRTKNGELAHMIRRRIAAFEKEHGPIELGGE